MQKVRANSLGLQEGKPKRDRDTHRGIGRDTEGGQSRERETVGGTQRGETRSEERGVRLGLGPGPGPLGPEETACRTPCSVSGLLLSGEAWQPAE